MQELSLIRSKIKILLLENIHSIAVDQLKSSGFHVETMAGALGEAELIEKAKDFHLIGIRSKTRITQAIVQESKKLMGIGCFCIGTNQVDLNAARSRGIPVFNAPFSNTRSVAEMVLAEIVMLARQLGDRNQELHRGEWKKISKGCFEVRGKTLGIVGYGHIGSQVSVLAESFGMKVVYYDIVSKMPIGNSQAQKSLEAVLEQADFVTLHIPETPQTKNMFRAQEFKSMKKGAALINASRGSVVNIDDLAGALKSGHLSGAAIDVYPEEPEGNSEGFKSSLQKLSNVVLTPHIGGSTEEAQMNIGLEVSDALMKFIDIGTSRGAVNFPQVDLEVLHGSHRILNIHRNVPGVLKDINGIMSDLGANIQSQYLATDSEIGYLIVDLDKNVSEKVKERIKALPTSIRTRILY